MLVKCALFKAHVGHLQLLMALLRWSSSSFSSWLLEQTVLVLCLKVLMTLNLADSWWWLSHCRFKSVCVGFLYTDFKRDLSGCGNTIVSRKGKDHLVLHPLSWIGCVGWCCSYAPENSLSLWNLWPQRCHPQPHPYSRRVYSWINDLDFKILHEEVGHNGADGRPHSCSLQLFKESALKLEVTGLQAELQ